MRLTHSRRAYPLLASLISLAVPAILAGQSPAASGGFVLLGGTDTIVTLRFTRDAQKLSVTMRQPPQGFQMSYTSHVIDAAGTQRVEHRQTYPDGSFVRRQTVYSAKQFRESISGSHIADQTREVTTSTRAASMNAMLVPSMEETIRGVQVAPGDSTRVFVHSPRTGDTSTVLLRRVKADSLVITAGNIILRLSISPASDILRGSIQYPSRTLAIVRVP